VYYLLLVSPPANRKENSWRSAAYDSDRRMQCSAVQLDLFGSAVLKMLHSASGVPTTRLIARSEQRFACSVCFLFSKMPCVAMTSHIQRIRTYKCVYLPVCELRTIYIYIPLYYSTFFGLLSNLDCVSAYGFQKTVFSRSLSSLLM
jgi:hypothetical protein